MAGDDGTAAIEFVLVLPFMLFLILLMVQTMLVMSGNVFVQRAAFAATRSAVIQVPADHSDNGGLGPNEFANTPGLPKYDAVERAAVFAVLPVCGPRESGGREGADLVDALKSYYDAYGRSHPNWLDRRVAPQLRYALANTRVQLQQTVVDDPLNVTFRDIEGTHHFTAKDPITVRVAHDLALTVPLAGYVFADGRHDGRSGRGFYTTISAQYTLTNEGIDEHLPPLPPLRRMP